jgi:hypothetical protein
MKNNTSIPNSYIGMHTLTNSRSWVLLQKQTVVQTLNIFLSFNGARRFITVFSGTYHWSLSWCSHLRLDLPSCLCSSGILTRNLYALIVSLMRVIYPVHLILLDFVILTIICQGVQVIKFLIIPPSPTSYYLIPLTSKIFSSASSSLEGIWSTYNYKMKKCSYRMKVKFASVPN